VACDGRKKRESSAGNKRHGLEDRFARLNRTLLAIRADAFGSRCAGWIGALSLETSRCRRVLSTSGFLTEVVRLDGIRRGLIDEELEQFVQGFPVEKFSARVRLASCLPG
jgi:hypothetical protein